MTKLRITEYLDLDLVAERWQCNRCGQDLGAAQANYKEGCLVAERDEVIPPVHAERLFAAWGGAKRKAVLTGASHNGTDAHPLFWPSIRAFLERPAGVAMTGAR